MTPTIKSARRDQGPVFIEGKEFVRWLVTIENEEQEVSTDVLRQPNSPDPTGLEAEQKSNGRWRVVSQQGGSGGNSNRGGGKYEADPVKLRAENRRSALHAAVSRANAVGPEVTASDIVKVAEAFHRYIEDQS